MCFWIGMVVAVVGVLGAPAQERLVPLPTTCPEALTPVIVGTSPLKEPRSWTV